MYKCISYALHSTTVGSCTSTAGSPRVCMGDACQITHISYWEFLYVDVCTAYHDVVYVLGNEK